MEPEMPCRLRRAFSLLGFCAVLIAQTQPLTPPLTGTVEGSVTESVTHKPVAGARVKLQAGERALFAMCDENGRFQFQEVPLGDYPVWADRPSYRPLGDPAKVRISSDKARAQVNVMLQQYGVISGRIADSAGVPLEGARIELLVLREIDPKRLNPYPLGPAKATFGDREIVAEGYATANDLGEYRIVGMAPGNYYLYYASGQHPSYLDPDEHPTYYPQTVHARLAKPVAIGPGQVVPNIDIQAIRQTDVRVSGRYRPAIVSPNPYSFPTKTYLAAWRPDAPEEESSEGFFVDGAFELKNFLPGRYVLEAATIDDRTDPQRPHAVMGGRRTIEVADKDLDGVEVAMQPPVDIPGAVVFGTNCPAVPVSIAPKLDTRLGCFSWLPPMDPKVAAAATGTFALPGLIPGKYTLAITPQPPASSANYGYSVASAKLGDGDVLQAGFELNGQPPGALRIAITCDQPRATQEVVR
jgi:hypothetical protein